MVRRVFSVFLLGFFLVVASLAAIAFWGYGQFTKPGPTTHDATVILARGSGVAGIARRLLDAGVITDADIFRFGIRAMGAGRHLKTGEYRVPSGASMREVVELLRSGRTVIRRLTVPEGRTTAEVMALLERAEGLVGAVPMFEQGRLLPETYHYQYGDSRAELASRMAKAMDQALLDVWDKRDSELVLKTPAEILTLASIIEKETGVASERAHIAGVFANRLRRGMLLQSDPTVVYALTDGAGPLGRPLVGADLDVPDPFNTYLVVGLPPGPIANPGRAALEAAAKPLATRDLYFVADGTGGHAFAPTYEAHLENIRRWRRLRVDAEAPASGGSARQ